MLMRNLNAKQGLANGTRLVVDALKSHTIKATILTGPGALIQIGVHT